MRRRRYSFRTDWRFAAPVERVWEAITDLEAYPSMWPDFRRADLVSGDGRSVGSTFECETRGALPYTLYYRLEVIGGDPPRSIELRSSGDLEGTGRWEFTTPLPGATVATYLWDVATTRPILNLIAPIARPLLALNHTRVMERGFVALRARIEGERLSPER